MNKAIIQSLAKYDFAFEKQLGYGHIEGYEVNVFGNPLGLGPIFFFSSFLPQTKKNDFILKMKTHKFPMVQAGFFDFGVSVMIGAMTSHSYGKKADEILATALRILQELEAPKGDICPQSGEVLEEKECRLAVLPNLLGIKIRMSEGAFATVNGAIDKLNEDFQAAPNHYLPGFGGVLLGAFAGSIVTIILWFLGFFSALGPLVSIVLGTILYRKFKGKPNAVMIIMTFLVTVVAIYLALLLLYMLAANGLLLEKGIEPTSGFASLSYCMENSPEFRRMFVSDMILNGVFILIAEGISIYRLILMIRRPKNLG